MDSEATDGINEVVECYEDVKTCEVDVGSTCKSLRHGSITTGRHAHHQTSEDFVTLSGWRTWTDLVQASPSVTG